jgi:hypothetical protein
MLRAISAAFIHFTSLADFISRALWKSKRAPLATAPFGAQRCEWTTIYSARLLGPPRLLDAIIGSDAGASFEAVCWHRAGTPATCGALFAIAAVPTERRMKDLDLAELD